MNSRELYDNSTLITGADPEVLNRGPNIQGGKATEQRLCMIEYLQLPVLSNCILTVAHTHNRHFRSK